MATDVVNVTEYESLAKQKLPKMAFDFFSTGAEDLWTLRENVLAFQRIRLRPRILVDVSYVDMSTEVLGFKISMPIMVAPTALHKLAHPEGELATARAASAANTIMVLSSSASATLEDVEKTGSGVRFFQLYIYRNREATARVVRKAESAGYKAIVLTVDTPVLGRREVDVKNRFTLPPGMIYSNFKELLDPSRFTTKGSGSVLNTVSAELDSTLSWESISWLKSITSLPILIKGVLTAEDARLGVRYGVAGVIVSNHGGRQLDYSPPTIDVLEEVVTAVAKKVPVFVDGGIRRGTDVFKAIALGATGVFVGRPVVYGLAVDGQAGVSKVLEMLRDEFEATMALTGCTRVNHINRSHVCTLTDSSHFSRL